MILDYICTIVIGYIVQVIVFVCILGLSSAGNGVFEKKKEFLFALIPYIYIIVLLKHFKESYKKLE